MFTIFLLLICGMGQWIRIPQYEVNDYLINYLEENGIDNCFQIQNENSLFLKCLRNNELIDLKIFLNLTRILYT